ncbi:hypothetical protein V6N12_049009 [Hibiscus sabdariffa]|uniref:Uncharacterized protein n=1 Tax=Hibiscus sabdariffa TaxID=183260 RepID=A0ABR2EIY5_9ROSI
MMVQSGVKRISAEWKEREETTEEMVEEREMSPSKKENGEKREIRDGEGKGNVVVEEGELRKEGDVEGD